MKRIYTYLLIIAAAALTACEKQPVSETPGILDQPYVFSIKASSPAIDTKTDYDDSGVFSWSSGDQISVLFNNGTNNKFFTLTTSESGDEATFSGTIDPGYTIGATDGTTEDKKIWALFPASNDHTYTPGENPKFYVQPVVDFSTTHFSANLPMYDKLAADGILSFKHLTGAYKLTIKDLDESIKTVRISISNQKTYALSGLWPIDSDPKLNYDYAAPGSANSCLTFTANVAENKAVLYIPCRRNSGSAFQPIISIYNAENDYIIKQFTATNPATTPKLATVKPLTISAPGTGNPFLSAYNINWSSETNSANGDTSADAVKLIKAKADSRYLYVYLEIPVNKIYSDDTYGYSNRSYLFVSDGSTGTVSGYWTQMSNQKFEGWLKQYNVPKFTINGGSNEIVSNKPSFIGEAGGILYMELAIDRSVTSYLQSTAESTNYVAFALTDTYKVGSGSTVYGDPEYVGFAPAKNASMLAVTLPAYVAP